MDPGTAWFSVKCQDGPVSTQKGSFIKIIKPFDTLRLCGLKVFGSQDNMPNFRNNLSHDFSQMIEDNKAFKNSSKKLHYDVQ